MSRQRHLLAAWALLVLGLAVRAFAEALVGPTAAPPLRIEPLVLDVNRASVAELRVLPGLGRTRAEAIVLERIRRGPFASLDELARIDGIGPLTVRELAPWLRCGERAAAAR